MELRQIVKKLFEKRAVVTAALLLGAQVLVYIAAKPVVALLPKVDFNLPIDARIPYMPAFFVPYLLCFAYWACMYLYIAGLGARRRSELTAAALCSSAVIGALFLLFPTEIERPAEPGGGFFGALAALAYGADTPYNLFPSFHCFASWLCFIGVRGAKEVKPWLKIAAFLAAILTFASTMLVKQHYFVDFIPSVFIAELFWLLARKTRLYLPFERFLERIFSLLGC
ncbi:MAG: phosphatase PAP2 family protein [Clostridiaceae bacterium]|nr:phosphatase PAP2 family protein [Eubacteriales bacterium]